MRALSLFSGGIDSTVATWWAMDQGWELTLLSYNYHRRPSPEIASTRALAERAGLRLIELDVAWMQELEDPRHPMLENPELASASQGYVPARNAMFYTMGAHYAELLGADRIVGGHNGGDTELFPDASPGFFEDLASVVSRGLATGTELEIVQPVHGLTKEEVVEMGVQLEAPLELSWSCYEEGPMPCEACPSCRRRADAFEGLRVPDPAMTA